MSGLIEFTHYQSEALLICLAASLAWAGLLLAGARGLEKAGSMSSTEKLWTAALLFAVLPSLVAPTLAAFGVSLRPAPADVAIEAIEFVRKNAGSSEEAPLAAGPTLLTTRQLIGAGALIYVYGVILTFFLWTARQAGLAYAVACAQRVTDARFLEKIELWADRLGVKAPSIKRSRHVSSVCITGVFHQTVLIPSGIEMRVSSDDLILMCAHELAHVRRGDTRLFTATQLARVLFWFNPLVARIAAHAELAAEESADSLVLAKGVDRRAYAACFVEGLKFAAFKMNVQPALAPSFTPADRNGRRQRLNAILSPEAPRKTPLAARLMVSAAASSVALVAFGQAALAVDPESGGEPRAILRGLPLIGDISLGFGDKVSGDIGKNRPPHEGLDIKAPKGAKIIAPGDGVVVEATSLYNNTPAWGKVVVVDHGNGLVTRYAHLDSFSVRKGERVKAGDVIAAVGETGRATGPHLHFETLRDGKSVDPVEVVTSKPDAPDAAAIEEPPQLLEIESPARVAPVESIAPSSPAPQLAAAPTARPYPAAGPRPVMRYSYSVAPAPKIPSAPGVRAFAPSGNSAEFKLSKPVVAPEGIAAPEQFSFSEPGEFGIAAEKHRIAMMAEDMEKQLLGALDGDGSAAYNLSFRNGDEVFRFTSDEPMTAEKRAELREALKSMRKDAEKAREAAARQREEWRKEMTRAQIDARQQATAGAEHYELSAEDLAEIRLQARMSRREALENQRDALEQSLDDLDEEFGPGIEDALSDLDDAEADLDDSEMTAEEIAAARTSIREQRRRLARDGDVHKRAIETARRQVEIQISQIERIIDALNDADAGD